MSRKVVVIGTGMAGISACLHLSKQNPTRPLSLVSHHSSAEATDDQSKIVRGDYESMDRMKEARMAQKAWKEEPFCNYYDTRGRIVAYDNSDGKTLQGINDNRAKLGLSPRERVDRDSLGRVFGNTNAPETLTYVHSPDDGLVDWKPCMAFFEEMAKDACIRTGGARLREKDG